MIWLIGSGGMSIDYLKTLKSLKKEVIVIGRGESSADNFKKQTGHSVTIGGLKDFLLGSPNMPTAVIVSVGVEQLFSTTRQLLNFGVKRILLEKPGALLYSELKELRDCAIDKSAEIFIAYNRRFYSSVIKLQELIKQDGGVTSFNFEFTEWSHIIEKLDKSPEVLSKWFIANSTHVIDLAFFLGGNPEIISCFTRGGLEWHSSSSIFAGAGVSDKGAAFNYGANWESAGRWSVEVLTKENRYILRPMESLVVQKRGAIAHVPLVIDNSLDLEYKPGLFKQVESFINGNVSSLCDLEEHLLIYPVYERMAGY